MGRRFGTFIIVVSVAAVLWTVLSQYQGMDGRFFGASPSSLKALAFYLIGDYRTAAEAYRAGLRSQVEAALVTAPTSWTALLAEDLDTADSLARRELRADPMSVHSILTLGEVALARTESLTAGIYRADSRRAWFLANLRRAARVRSRSSTTPTLYYYRARYPAG